MTIRFVSLFAGIGNADAGMYAAARDLGVEVECVAAYDSDAKCVEVFNSNMPHPVAVVADVKHLTRADLPPHDLVIGGPPCQPWSLAGKRGGASDERDCLPDFIRLSAGSAWLMENVIPRLIPSVPFSVKLNAFDFGDVTTRKRWFYSNYLLHVIQTPGPLRFGDIRDREADQIAIAKHSAGCGRNDSGEKVSTYADAISSLTAHAWHGRDVRSNVKMVAVRGRGRHGNVKMLDDVAFGSFTAESGHRGGTLKVGLRGHSASASASAFDDDEPIGSLIANSWHGNERSKLGPSVRCPSLLEMARAHSIPDTFDWCGATKTARGKMIANSWPRGLAAGVCRAMLVAMGAVSKQNIA